MTYDTKWTRARKSYLHFMRLTDQSYEDALNCMIARRDASYRAARNGDYKSQIIADRLHNAVTYAVNLAFGKDLAKQ